MFEYIKRVSIAIKFIANKIHNNKSLKDILELESLEFLKLAQDFRSEDYELNTLKILQTKVLYIIDVVDFARLHNLVTANNAKIFIESLNDFLKHVNHLIDQVYSLESVLLNLKEEQELMSRKIAKETLQNKYAFAQVATDTISKMSPFIPAKILEKKEVTNVTDSLKIDQKTSAKAQTKKEIEEGIKEEIEKRRKEILKILSQGGGSIREVADKFSEVNEKTIQRDLLELMRERKIIMLGTKRWAKYYIR